MAVPPVRCVVDVPQGGGGARRSQRIDEVAGVGLFTKFNMLAWIMPPLLLLVGIAGTVVLVRRWRLRAAARPAVHRTAQFQVMRDRVRKETEL